MTRSTQIGGGIQYHHQHNLGGASREAVNMCQWLAGAAEITGDPLHRALHEDAVSLCRRIGEAYREAHGRLASLYEANPWHFNQCRLGIEPWPDELAEGFEPICTCDRRCLFHDTKASQSTHDDCNCAMVCPRHKILREKE